MLRISVTSPPPPFRWLSIRGNSSNKPPLRVDLLLNEGGGVYSVWGQICPKFSPPAVRFSIVKSIFRGSKMPKFSACGGLYMVILEGFAFIYKVDFPKISACGGLYMVILEGFVSFTRAISKIFACGAQNTSF